MELNSRQSGKDFKAYLEFKDSIKKGKNNLWVGFDYVVMSKKNFDELQPLYLDIDLDSLEFKAGMFAQDKHKDQLDDEGLPYFTAHILQVVNILKQITTDKEIIATAYLHDCLEDTDTTYEELEENFGKTIADLVLELTHEGNKTEGYTFPRLKSKKAIITKFADRLSNLSRMSGWDKKRQEHYMRKSKFWKY